MRYMFVLAHLATLPGMSLAQDQQVTFIVTRGNDGPIETEMLWDIYGPDLTIESSFDTQSEHLVLQSQPALLPLRPGAYTAHCFGVGEDIEGRTSFTVADAPVSVTCILTHLAAPANGIAGTQVPVTWIGPDEPGDFIGIADPEDGLNTWITRTFTRDGNPAIINLPTAPAQYELRYFRAGGDQPLAVTNIVTSND